MNSTLRFSILPSAFLCSALIAGSLAAQDAPESTPSEKPAPVEAQDPKAEKAEASKGGKDGDVQPADASAVKADFSAPYHVGSPVDPGLKLTTLDGKEWSFKDSKDQTIFIHFWSGTCPFMKPAEPLIRQMAKEYSSKGVVFLAINANRTELPASLEGGWETSQAASTLKRHAKENELSYPMLLDVGNAVADQFSAHTTPHCFVVHRGVIEYAGALTDDSSGKKEEPTNYVRNALDSLLDGKPVETPKTTPYGCSIKRVPAARKQRTGGEASKPERMPRKGTSGKAAPKKADGESDGV